MMNERRRRGGKTGNWLKQAIPWSAVKASPDLRDEESGLFELKWRVLCLQLRREAIIRCSSDPINGFECVMDICRVVREVLGEIRPTLAEALLSPLYTEIVNCVNAIKVAGGDLLVERLHAVLTHEDLCESDLPEEIGNNLIQADALSLLKRLADGKRDVVADRRIFPILTDLAVTLDIDTLIQAGNDLDLWPRVDTWKIVERFLIERRCDPPFASLVVQAVQDGECSMDKLGFLKQCLALCNEVGSRDVAQQIRFWLFAETCGVGFARDWLNNLPGEGDPTVRQAHIFQRVLRHRSRGKALMFFIDWPDLQLATEVAKTLPHNPDDIDSWQLARASEVLEQYAPTIAQRLMRQACTKANELLRQVVWSPRCRPAEPTWHVNWLAPLADDHAEQEDS